MKDDKYKKKIEEIIKIVKQYDEVMYSIDGPDSPRYDSTYCKLLIEEILAIGESE